MLQFVHCPLFIVSFAHCPLFIVSCAAVGPTFRPAWHVYKERGCSGLAFCQYDSILRIQSSGLCVFAVGWMKTLIILSLSPEVDGNFLMSMSQNPVQDSPP